LSRTKYFLEGSDIEAQTVDYDKCAHYVEECIFKEADASEIKATRKRIENWFENMLYSTSPVQTIIEKIID
jgi:hypothetical protein